MIFTQKRSENLIYALLWAMVLALPVFTLKGSDEFNLDRVILEWIRILPFLLIFIINNSLLAPKLLIRKKLIWYFTSITVIVIFFAVLNDLPRLLHDILLQGRDIGGNPMHQGGPIHPGGPMDPSQAFREPIGGKSVIYLMFENVIISFLVVGFNNAIILGISRQKEEMQQEEKEKIHLKTKLSFLRQQISPHFFMNTLNNIHALIEMDQVQAQKSVIELSKLMRYLLNESQQGTTTIKAEFEFLNSYIDLMRIRYTDKVKIDINLNVKEDNKKIPSLLFISLVENAFKYGISYSNNSYISIETKQDDKTLQFEIKNSISSQSKVEKGTGLGQVNLQKQLDILFQEYYTFEINESETEYQVTLIIPLQYD